MNPPSLINTPPKEEKEKETGRRFCVKCESLVAYITEKTGQWAVMFPLPKGKWRWVTQDELKLPDRCPVCGGG